MYSSEEIERKRRMALMRKAQHQQGSSISRQSGYNNNGVAFKRKLDSSPAKEAKQIKTIPPVTFFSTPSRINVDCSIISESRFQINVQYNKQLIDFFRTIKSSAYDVRSKLWNFHIRDYSATIKGMISEMPGLVNLSGIPQAILQMFERNLETERGLMKIDLSDVDPVLTSQLMSFQREGIHFAIEKRGRCMIADEMGLGKTIQALGVAHYYRDSWPLLIVTPSSVRHQWSDAIYQFLPSVPSQHVFQYSSGKDYLGSEKITIVSYDLLARNIHVFERKTFGFVIFDESHVLKSPKTERTKAAKSIAGAARHILLLTGTPALSRPIELYTQISLINPNFMKMQDYGIRYCQGKKGSFGWDFQGMSNTQELQLFLKSSYVIRRLKSDVLHQLPDKIRQVVLLDPDLIKAGTKEMQKMADKLKLKTLEGFEKHAELMRYYAESSQQKLTAVGSYVKDLVDKKVKFMIFAHHVCVLDKISEVLDKNHVNYVRIDGKTPADVRKKRVDKFQESDNCLVAVLSITAANSGITLTAASFVVFAELYWNPAELTQAEARAHRIGQRNCVIIQYLIAKGTVDDIIWPMLHNKARFLQNAGLDQNFSLRDADQLQQTTEESSSSEEKKQGTLESFGFSQSTDNDFTKLLDDDDEDFENIDLDNIT